MLSVASTETSSGQTYAPPPDGVRAGRVYLQPWITTSYEYEDNVFRRSEDGTCSDDPTRACRVNADCTSPAVCVRNEIESDRVKRLIGGLVVTMPVRMSELQMGYEAAQVNYEQNQFSRDKDKQGFAEFTMRFRNFDELRLRESFTRSISEVQTNVNNELVFDGQPYNRNVVEVELDRAQPNRQGFSIHLSRVDLTYEPGASPSFFQYRGFDNSFEYRQPLPARKWITVYYNSRRFNHYLPQCDDDPNTVLLPCPPPEVDPRPREVGVPFRKEVSDTIQLGLRGELGQGQPFLLRMGYQEFRYELQESSQFRGVSGEANWSMNIGARTKLDLGALRRPLPSNARDTAYLLGQFRARLRRDWLSESEYGLDLTLGRSRYTNVSPDFPDCGDEKRHDNELNFGGFVEWVPRRLLGLRLSARHQIRSSNCPTANYSVTEILAGMNVGWF